MLAPIPVTVIGGYLGAGKTTLVNAVLRQAAGRRLAVLVNEFGTLPIDQDLIEGQDGTMMLLAGGCVCCSFGSDLIGALMDLRRRVPRPDHVLIEASGVALPGAIAQSLTLLAGFSLDSVIVLADAETLAERCADPYLADTMMRQMQDADLVVLNKVDCASIDALETSRQRIADLAPQARCLETTMAQISIDILLGIGGSQFDADQQIDVHDGALHDSLSLPLRSPTDLQFLVDSVMRPDLHVLRAKGFVYDMQGQCHLLQIVGGRVELSAAEPRPGRLVLIGLAGRFDKEALRRVIMGSEQTNRAGNEHGDHNISRDFAG